MLRFSSSTTFDAWLDERYGFADGHLARLERTATDTVTVVLEEYRQRGWRPGDIAIVDSYELIAEQAELDAPTSHNPTDVLESVETDESGERIVIEFTLGAQLIRLRTTGLNIRLAGTERRRTTPWVANEFTVHTDRTHDDQFWASRVSTILDMPAVWRTLGGREARAPGLDPDGCFLQKAALLSTTDQGVFYTRFREHRSTWRAWHRDIEPDLWHAVRLVATEFAQIHTGNCVFNSADWATFVATNTFPPDERLTGRPTSTG
ncbi:hypothetical protein EV191_1011246 [Tamaricihabitans halophyticus]|uniref:Uncharacterized protein n=1 Tax=Tamaricihabitans halophyticus TaxID=1262583 RepID=A0A4R2R3A7_9PSEU|nr:hypothetical protein [Tamaricihabitans halophyticus]TCP57292.1 hypothetical protein EV191_1011246 [Tamaricihabitans halophyticus]